MFVTTVDGALTDFEQGFSQGRSKAGDLLESLSGTAERLSTEIRGVESQVTVPESVPQPVLNTPKNERTKELLILGIVGFLVLQGLS